VWNQDITKPKKMWGEISYYIPTVWKRRGPVPRVPHLIAPMEYRAGFLYLCIQTLGLQCSWHEGSRADIKVIAWQAFTNTVCDKLLNAKATRGEEPQTVAASLCDFPLTWRNARILIYWLWKMTRIIQWPAPFQHERTNLY